MKINEPIKKALSHPITLLLVGALVSSIVIPAVSRPWQAQKEVELKIALADDISKSVSDSLAIASSYSAGIGDVKDFASSFITWQTSKSLLDSKIRALYSGNSALINNWDNLSSAVNEVSFYLMGNRFPRQNTTLFNYDVCNRLAHVFKLYTLYPQHNPFNIDQNVLTKYGCNKYYFPVLNFRDFQNFPVWSKNQKYFPIKDSNEVDWNALFYNNFTNYAEVGKSYATLQKDIVDNKNNLLNDIFRSHITAF